MYWSSTQPTVQPWHSAQDRPCSSSDNGRKHAESMHSHYAAWAPCHPSAITPGPFLTSLRKSTNVFDEAQIHKLHIGTYRPLKCISHNSQQGKKKKKEPCLFASYKHCVKFIYHTKRMSKEQKKDLIKQTMCLEYTSPGMK